MRDMIEYPGFGGFPESPRRYPSMAGASTVMAASATMQRHRDTRVVTATNR
jgi:hypothetical protein